MKFSKPPKPIGRGKPSPAPAGESLLKETCRRIRAARVLWDAHRNAACRGERQKALALYEQLSAAEREKIPQELRVWLRYRTRKFDTP